MKKFVSLLCMATLLYGGPSQAHLQSIESQSVGYVTLAEDALADGDFVIAIFSDILVLDPTRNAFSLPSRANVAPIRGCLSVAQLKLHSGETQLPEPGTLTFGCSDLPDGTAVYGWINNGWTPVPSRLGRTGQIEIEFTDLTVYALFPRAPNEKPRLLS